MGEGIPAAEVRIDAELVGQLLRTQHPDLADESLRFAGEGWDCVMFQIGEGRAARLPRRASAAPLALIEQRWLPQLSPHLPLPTPTPERVGLPGPGYPWTWSIVPWFEGASVDRAPLHADAAEPLARFLIALHRPAPVDAPTNSWRGVSLARRAEPVEEWMTRLDARPEFFPPALAREVRSVWRRALAAPIDVADTWLHGDLHPRNVLGKDGSIAAILDWGDMCRGDRATDLASLWTLLPTARARAQARACIDQAGPLSPETWARAQGWAVFFGAILLAAGLDDGDLDFARGGQRTLEHLAEDGASI